MDRAPMRIGRVRLKVRDLARVSEFYRQALGMSLLDQTGNRATLGTPSEPLLDLIGAPGLAPSDRHGAGLFHTAFLLPDRADLGRWLAHIAARGVRLQGASDHLVSEAVYLSDPEGNGIEVYADRPVADWPVSGTEIKMATEPMDYQGVLDAGAGSAWSGMPEHSRVGHMHLQVGNTKTAEAFWHGIVGFDVTCHYPGAAFFGSGGYHHQLAGNVWNSRGAGIRPDGTAGLESFEIVATDPAILDAVAARAAAEGLTADRGADSLTLNDPWGIGVTLRG